MPGKNHSFISLRPLEQFICPVGASDICQEYQDNISNTE